MKKLALFGTKSTSGFLLRALAVQWKVDCLIALTPEQGRKQAVADYTDLRPLCEELGIEVFHPDRYSLQSESDIAFLKSRGLDLAFVMGWQRLIPAAVLESLSVGAFGMHGSSENLPKGRGRSPMNWSLIEGRTTFYTNLFRYDAGVDSGDIVDTVGFSIGPADTAETLHFKNTLAMKNLVLKNAAALMSGNFVLNRQAGQTPTYYPKREPGDSLIDWSQSALEIDRFVRAVTRPFNGAFTFAGENRVTVWRASVFELGDWIYPASPPAEILEVFPGGKFVVKTGQGLLLVHEFESAAPLEAGTVLGDGSQSRRIFSRNAQGHYDCELPN